MSHSPYAYLSVFLSQFDRTLGMIHESLHLIRGHSTLCRVSSRSIANSSRWNVGRHHAASPLLPTARPPWTLGIRRRLNKNGLLQRIGTV